MSQTHTADDEDGDANDDVYGDNDDAVDDSDAEIAVLLQMR